MSEGWRISCAIKKLSEITKKYPDAFHLCYKKEKVFAIYRVKPQYLKGKDEDLGNYPCVQ